MSASASAAPRVLLDTNIVIGLLKGDASVKTLVEAMNVSLSEMAVSQITRMELLSFSGLTTNEQSTTEMFVQCLHVIGIDDAVEACAVRLRKNRKIKLPDAIIAATALSRGLVLLTLDQALTKIVADNIT